MNPDILIRNVCLVLPDRLLPDAWLTVSGSAISAFGTGPVPEGVPAEVIDGQGKYLSPGFIDIHTHGAGGADFMDGTAEAFVTAAMEHLRHGTTTLVPTTLTCSPEELDRSFCCYQTAAEALKGKGPNLAGMHLEGPFFSAEQAGAQDPEYLQVPTPENVCAILKHSSQIARISAAVELPGSLELGDELKKRGILAAIGHSNAEYEDVAAAVQHGFSHVTHLYSGMSMLHRIGPYRHLGVVEASYLMDELTVEIIADGIHLPPELLRLILKCKPIDKICLITDSMRGAGLPDGSVVKLGSLSKGQDVILENGVAMLMDRTAFAGSICTDDRCVHNMHILAGASLPDAVRMMTANPARIMGLKNKGILEPGMDADLCIFDGDIRVSTVIVMGKRVLG